MTGKNAGSSFLKRTSHLPRQWVRGFLDGWGWRRHHAPNPPLNHDKPHHVENGFRNPHPHDHHNFRDFFRWQLRLGKREIRPVAKKDLPRRYKPRRVKPNLDTLHSPDPSILQITWIGHTTFLIQAEGVNLLTDPIFSQRCSPLRFVGPRRKAPPGLHPSQLPPIDAVVISHDHYDHLDRQSILMLGNRPRYYLPLGLSAWFRKRGLTNFEEKDWGDSTENGPLRLHCLPAQHFSGRSLFDRNRTLWCSWAIELAGRRIYFLGDTGYAPYFRETGERMGPFDCALIPIGAYRPRWYMNGIHVDTREAVQIHKDVQSRFSIASHWGTFKLAEEPAHEPPHYLDKVLAEEGISRDLFRVLDFGETVQLVPDEDSR